MANFGFPPLYDGPAYRSTSWLGSMEYHKGISCARLSKPSLIDFRECWRYGDRVDAKPTLVTPEKYRGWVRKDDFSNRWHIPSSDYWTKHILSGMIPMERFKSSESISLGLKHRVPSCRLY